MNNIGRNKTKWLLKNGCKFIDKSGNPVSVVLKQIDTYVETEYGEYVGLADLGKYAYNINFIYKHRLTNLMSINRAKGLELSKDGCNTVSVGFSEKEQAWYGWTHRGYAKFYIGYEVIENSICDCGNHKYPFKVETLEQAKELAADIADYLN